MLKAFFLIITFISYPAAITFQHGSQLKSLTSKDIRKLEKGDVLKFTSVFEGKDGRHYGWGTAVGLVDAPFKKMKNIILNFELFPKFLPNLEALKVIERRRGNVLAYHRVKALWMKIEYHLIYRIKEERDSLKITWKLAKNRKNDLRDTKGYWFIKRWNKGKTLLIYSSFVDSGRKMPVIIEKLVMSITLPEVIKSVREYVGKNGNSKEKNLDFGF